MKIKKLIRIGGIITIIMVIVGSIYLSNRRKAYRSEDLQLEKYGVIENIKISDVRDTPYFSINGEWVYLGYYGYSLINEAMVNNSISKPNGDDTLLMFRKNESKEYTLIRKIRLR